MTFGIAGAVDLPRERQVVGQVHVLRHAVRFQERLRYFPHAVTLLQEESGEPLVRQRPGQRPDRAPHIFSAKNCGRACVSVLRRAVLRQPDVHAVG